MADIQVRIKLNAGVSGDEIQSVDFNQETNNVSKTIGSKTTKNDGQNLISWGEKGLIPLIDGYVGGASSTLSSEGGYNGFVFGVVPENKLYSVEVTLEGQNIDSVTIYGDRNANQFPTRAYLDGDTSNYIYSDDPEWTILFPSASASHTITFDMWNRSNYNACLTHIGVFVNELVLDKRWIKSVESLSQSTGQPKDIYYGVTPSSGNIEIIDINGEIKDYIQDGILDPDNLPISIFANNKKINEQIINSSSYFGDAMLSGGLMSKLAQWDNIMHPTRKLTSSTNLYEILKDVMINSNACSTKEELDKMLKRRTLIDSNDTEMIIKSYLTTIKIPYPYIESNFVRRTLDDICTIAQLNVHQRDDGQIEFISSRPVKLSNEKVIKINAKNIFNKEQDIIIRNKHDGISCIQYFPIYDYKNDGAINVEFFTLPSPTIINGKMYYPYNFNSFEEDYSYVAKDYDNFKLLYDKAILEDETNGYYAIYKYTPSSDLISKYANNLGINCSAMQSKNIVQDENGTYYIAPFQDYVTTTNVHSSGGRFTKEEFNEGVEVSDDNVIIHWYVISKEDGLPISFYGSGVGAYTVVNGDGDIEYYVILPTHHLYYNTVAFSTNGIVSKSYSMNMMIKGLTFEEKKFSYGDLPFEINSSKLIQTQDVIQRINSNIQNDYSKGIKTANITISCSDYYYLDGMLAKDWLNGDIIQVGEIVKFDGDDNIWRVTGRNFRKNGVPMLDLELREVINSKYLYHLVERIFDENAIVELSGTDAIYDFYMYRDYNFDANSGIVTVSNKIEDATEIKTGDVLYRSSGGNYMAKYEILKDAEINPSNNRWVINCNISSFDVMIES